MNEPETFIATVTNDERSFEQDMELPSGMPVSELSAQILMILKEIHDDVFSRWSGCYLEYNNRILGNDDTLLKAGAFDGSVLIVREA